MKSHLTRIIEKRGDGYIAYVKEVLEIDAQGMTFAKARLNLDDAVRVLKSGQSPKLLCSRKS